MKYKTQSVLIFMSFSAEEIVQLIATAINASQSRFSKRSQKILLEKKKII